MYIQLSDFEEIVLPENPQGKLLHFYTVYFFSNRCFDIKESFFLKKGKLFK
jgi:hypothetical protein